MKLISITFVMLSLLSFKNSAMADDYQTSTHRVLDNLKVIYKNVDDLRFSNHKIIVSYSSESNAWSAGSLVIVTTALLKKLDNRSLTAVLLHEIAHSKKFHMIDHFGKLIGINVLFSINRLSNWITNSKNEKTYTEDLYRFFEQYNTPQEMQADCMAYNWLKELKSKGLNFDPLDLNRATDLIFEIDFSKMPYELGKDLPPYLRSHKIIKGYGSLCPAIN